MQPYFVLDLSIIETTSVRLLASAGVADSRFPVGLMLISPHLHPLVQTLLEQAAAGALTVLPVARH